VINRLGSLYAFLRYLIEHDLTDAQLLARKIKLKFPDALPRAMNAEDVKCLLAVLDDVRNRVMILLLLRTGMRIGELLNTKVVDVYLADKKIMVYEGEKNRKGRAVCFSNDAGQALQDWLQQRDSQKQYLFYGRGGSRMSYNNARVLLKNISGAPGWNTRTTACIACAIPLLPSCLMPACTSSACSICWVIPA